MNRLFELCKRYTYDIIDLFVIACQIGSISNLECFDMAAEKGILFMYATSYSFKTKTIIFLITPQQIL